MHPIELIEHLLVAVVVFLMFAASYGFRGKWRKMIRLLAVLCIIAYAVFYAIRPSLIEERVAADVVILEDELEERYPNETFTVTTIPFRTEGYESTDPYTIYVTFSSEPDAEYYYQVTDQGEIEQRGFSSTIEGKMDFQHFGK
ncbi:hypothetical protein EVJ33_03195 [Exiguobacterium sp. SL-10]|uniref:hypothetical protein n=1 Tax=unclassified Exiguobacterium TaxID=2644629 RepID=UPI00103C1E89|nr:MULTISPECIES: hypothetical protein [unclassified Exiguobacterium]TCI21177.1 hypothetical protein EVJ34_12175 [Exiguobacterium sp. SL-9]TCI31068.1 hypothetical protein EVJ33_03195 [Exiguobacterium sp. SL-10]